MIIVTILYAWNWNIVNTYITLSAPLTTPHAHVKKPYLQNKKKLNKIILKKLKFQIIRKQVYT